MDMFMFFVSDAFAETATGAQSGIGSSLVGFVPLILVFLVFYFLIIRPQQKKAKEHAKMLSLIKKGDKVTISHSIMGVVTKVDNENSILSVEIANSVVIKVLKGSISEVVTKLDSSKSEKYKTAEGENNQEYAEEKKD